MGVLTVRQVNDEVIRQLKRRAVEAGVSAEEMHRRILGEALTGPRPTTQRATDVLQSLHEGGLDLHDVTKWGEDWPLPE